MSSENIISEKAQALKNISYVIQHGNGNVILNNKIGEFLLAKKSTIKELTTIVWSCADPVLRSRAWDKLLNNEDILTTELVNILTVRDLYNEFHKVWEPLNNRKLSKDELQNIFKKSCCKEVKQKALHELTQKNIVLDYYDLSDLIRNQIDVDSTAVDLLGNIVIEMQPQKDVLGAIIYYCTDEALFMRAWHALITREDIENDDLINIILITNEYERQLKAWNLLSNKDISSMNLINIICNCKNEMIQNRVFDFLTN